MKTKMTFGIILALIIVATICVVRIGKGGGDKTITQLYTGNISEQAYSAKGNVRSCPQIMMEAVYRIPLNDISERGHRINNSLVAYDKYGTSVVDNRYGSPQSTYSCEIDEEGILKGIAWHDFTRETESEYGKTVWEYYPESDAVGITRWDGPSSGSPNYTAMWTYELDDNGRALKRTETSNCCESTTFEYKRDVNGNVTHELEYFLGKLFWDKWHTYDSEGHEMMTGVYDMVGIGASEVGTLMALDVYENKAFDECGNWTCRVVDCKGFQAGETIFHKSYTEYRSLLYYPD